MKFIRRFASIIYLIWCMLIFISSMILVLPFILISTTLFKGKQAHQFGFVFLRIWGWIFSTLNLFLISRKVSPNLNLNRSHIFVSNHNSYLDSVALVKSSPQAFKPLGKIEMLKVPVFGIIYRRMVVLIDRKDKESRMRCIEDLKKDLALGLSILIFPEGTMNKTDEPLAEFYDGAFRLAIETQTPILPVAIINARNLMPRKNMLLVKPGFIKCIYGDPIEVTGLNQEDLPALKAKVHGIMTEMIVKAS
ncbi:MAG: 1-acyl-sn-glycerol-3-phosphate acyltransferase [Daejeonella sp.]